MDLNLVPITSNLSAMDKNNNLRCDFCLSSVSNKKNCNRHKKFCTKNKERLLRCEFTCSKCQAFFNRKDNLNKHTKICNADTSGHMSDVNTNSIDKPLPNTRPNKIKMPCLVENCDKTFYHKSALINHLGSAHQDVVTLKDKEERIFSTNQEFVSWKEEEKTFSYFTQKKVKMVAFNITVSMMGVTNPILRRKPAGVTIKAA